MRRIELKSAPLSTILLFSMLVSLLFISFVAKSASATPDGPIHIHLTWGQNDAAHTIVVTWKTTTENAGDVVRYDTRSGGGDPDNYAYSKTGSHHTYSGAGGYVHDVELTGLSPNTVYYFICGGENGGWSEERSFRTAPDQRTSFRFVAGGDSRSGGDWPRWRDNISHTMAKFNPSFVLFTGDFVMTGSNQGEWDNWFAAAQMYWVDNDNLTIPIIPCIGNHESPFTSYYGQFCLPGNEQWYSLDWGPDLHIIALNNYSGLTGEQLDWLKSDLAAHENCLWKVVIFHEPPFSSGSHGSDMSVRTYWVPVFDNYHVDLVISGHDHDYERTYPINYTISENTPMPSPESGTVYIVSGGWGAPLYEVGSHWWTAYSQSTYNFAVVDIFDNGTLHLQTVGTDGETFDEYYIHKDIYDVGVSISPLENRAENGETVTFTVSVTNTGKEADNYDLTITDDAGWGATLSENKLLNLENGASGTVTVSVTIPSGAAKGMWTVITVTATSRADPSATDSDTCKAIAGPEEDGGGFPVLPIVVGGAAVGGGIAVAILIKKGIIHLSFLRLRFLLSRSL